MSERLELHPRVKEFLREVCSEVKAKDVHADIKQELLNHLEETVETLQEDKGIGFDEAIDGALKQMGDSRQIGRGFHAVHRPKPEWGTIALVACMVAIAIVSLFALHMAYSEDPFRSSNAVSSFFAGVIGIAGMITLYFVDYRKLVPYSWLLYGGTVLAMLYANLGGTQINGVKSWIMIGNIIAFNVQAVAPYLLIIAAAGMLSSKRTEVKNDWKSSLRSDIMFFILLALIPGYLFWSTTTILYLGIYGVGLAVLLLACGKVRQLLAALSLSVIPVLLIFWIESARFSYIHRRLFSFLNPNGDEGYMTMRSVETIQSGGFWGQGIGITANDIRLPMLNSEMLFSYLVHSLGWVFGAAVVAIIILFLARIIRVGLTLKDTYGKRLTLGLATVFGVKSVWNIMMSLGWLPIVGIQLPLINWSLITIVEFMAIGLLLSVYRRRDMVGELSSNGTGAAYKAS